MTANSYQVTPRVAVSLRNDHELEIAPRGYLGGPFFELYRNAVGKVAKYDRESKRSVCPLGSYGELRGALEDAGFQVVPERSLVRLITEEETRRKSWEEGIDRTIAIADGIRPLFGYQHEGARFLAARARALLADEPGLGKTVQTLAALPSNARTIVVCPAIARMVWLEDTAFLRPDLKARRVRTDSIPTPEEGEMLILSYEDVIRRVMPGEFERHAPCVVLPGTPPCGSSCTPSTIPKCFEGGGVPRFSTFSLDGGETRTKCMELGAVCLPEMPSVPGCTHLITDEAHYLKNPRSQRSIAHGRLESKASVAWHLTGTPVPNTPAEFWQVLDSVRLAKLAFGTWELFVEIMGGVFEEIKVQGGKKRRVVQWPDLRAVTGDTTDKMRDDIRALLAKVMLRRKKSEVLKDLPEKIFRTIKVDVDEAMDRECDRMQDRLRALLGLEIEQVDDLSMLPIEEIAPMRKKLAIAKIPAAIDFVELHESAGRPLVVFSAHLEPVAVIGKRKGWAKIDGGESEKRRIEAKRAFQAGELKGIAASIRAAGTALTLTAASDLLFVDKDWTPSNNDQAVDRVHRIGQDRGVVITTLVSSHPMDAHVTEVLSRKNKTIRTILG